MNIRWISIGFAVVFVLWCGWLFAIFRTLPEEIPIHFNGLGEADGWGHRNTLWLLPAVALFTTVVVIGAPLRAPDLINYPVKITPENKQRQWDLMMQFMIALAALCLILFMYISYVMVRKSLGHSSPSVIWLWLQIGLMFVLMGIYWWRSRKAA